MIKSIDYCGEYNKVDNYTLPIEEVINKIVTYYDREKNLADLIGIAREGTAGERVLFDNIVEEGVGSKIYPIPETMLPSLMGHKVMDILYNNSLSSLGNHFSSQDVDAWFKFILHTILDYNSLRKVYNWTCIFDHSIPYSVYGDPLCSLSTFVNLEQVQTLVENSQLQVCDIVTLVNWPRDLYLNYDEIPFDKIGSIYDINIVNAQKIFLGVRALDQAELLQTPLGQLREILTTREKNPLSVDEVDQCLVDLINVIVYLITCHRQPKVIRNVEYLGLDETMENYQQKMGENLFFYPVPLDGEVELIPDEQIRRIRRIKDGFLLTFLIPAVEDDEEDRYVSTVYELVKS